MADHMAGGKGARKGHRTRRKKRSVLSAVLTVLLVLLLLAAGGVGFLALRSLNRIEKVDKEKEVWITPEFENFETDELEPSEAEPGAEPGTAPAAEPGEGPAAAEPNEIVWQTPEEVPREDHVHNILLIGQDRRPGEGRARSDSMIICSINEKTKEIRLCSLMRDLYVPFPGGYSDNRINAAYAFGGMSLLDKLIQEDFGITIDGNVEVDFDGFIKVMDMIAPLEIELTDAEAWFLNQSTGWLLRTGVNALTGEQILAYARLRYIGHADFERTERQRRVLNIAFNKVRKLSLSELYALADAALPCITTDLSNTDIINYVYLVAVNRMSIGGNYRIPADGTYTPQSIRGMSVLVPDLAKNSALLREYLYQ